MVTPRIEFSGAELATFEFGREAYTYAVEAEFFGAGAAVVIPVTAPIAFAGFAGSGAAAFTPGISGVANAEAICPGDSETYFSALEIRLAGFSGPSAAAGAFVPGTIIPADFSAAGSSTGGFALLDGNGWDFVCRSVVTFNADATVYSQIVSNAGASVVFVGGPFANTRMAAAGVSTFDTPTTALASVQFDSPGVAEGAFGGFKSLLTAFSSSSAAAMAPTAMAIANTAAAAAGADATSIITAAITRKYADLVATGTGAAGFISDPRAYVTGGFAVSAGASVAPQAQAVYSAVMTMAGGAQVSWVLGRQVFASLPAAHTVVDRPAENREVERPFELRAADWN